MGSLLAFSGPRQRARGCPPGPRGAVTEAGPAPGDLAPRIAAGDRGAEEELVARYGEGLAFLLRRFTRDRETADDLYQETFRRALEKLRRGELRDPASLPSFLRGLARNLSIDHYRGRARRSGRERPLDEASEPPDERTGQLGSLLREERIALVRRLVGEVPRRRDREVLLRFYLEEEDKQRIQSDLGLSGAELNLVLFRARRRCQALFEEA
ncbi:MAG TPA: RNA polymerase sigma factor, partial [Thermoanaerobaculia bacterium]|nr:RNA polymerase sigma factor [Thermoanaerobaculia bacterium]